MANPRTRILICVIVACSIFLVAFFVSVSLVAFLAKRRERDFSIGGMHMYKYTQVNIHNNETNTGFVTLSKELGRDEYVSYEGEDGDYVIISNFESREYQCTGSCFCEAETRRSATHTLSQGVFYLTVALTSILAYNKAKDHFKEECKQSTLSEQCPENAVRSEVRECKDVSKEGLEDDMVAKKDLGRYVYECMGKCLVNTKLIAEEHRKEAEEYECEKLEAHANVLSMIDYDAVDFSIDYSVLAKNEYDNVRRKFMDYRMEEFCIQNSKEHVPFDCKGVRLDRIENAINYCRADPVDGTINPTVVCVRDRRW